ncbi:MAG TPA: hypothetical protein VI306_18435 [Pyrinomonadaceae bacterium]
MSSDDIEKDEEKESGGDKKEEGGEDRPAGRRTSSDATGINAEKEKSVSGTPEIPPA